MKDKKSHSIVYAMEDIIDMTFWKRQKYGKR